MGAGFCSLYQGIHYIKVRYIKVWGTCNTYTYPTVKMGWILDRFCNKYPLSRPRTSIWNVCSNPPPNPTEQDTDNPWVVWLWTSQFWGGSGGPEIKTKNLTIIKWYVSSWIGYIVVYVV